MPTTTRRRSSTTMPTTTRASRLLTSHHTLPAPAGLVWSALLLSSLFSRSSPTHTSTHTQPFEQAMTFVVVLAASWLFALTLMARCALTPAALHHEMKKDVYNHLVPAVVSGWMTIYHNLKQGEWKATATFLHHQCHNLTHDLGLGLWQDASTFGRDIFKFVNSYNGAVSIMTMLVAIVLYLNRSSLQWEEIKPHLEQAYIDVNAAMREMFSWLVDGVETFSQGALTGYKAVFAAKLLLTTIALVPVVLWLLLPLESWLAEQIRQHEDTRARRARRVEEQARADKLTDCPRGETCEDPVACRYGRPNTPADAPLCDVWTNRPICTTDCVLRHPWVNVGKIRQRRREAQKRKRKEKGARLAAAEAAAAEGSMAGGVGAGGGGGGVVPEENEEEEEEWGEEGEEEKEDEGEVGVGMAAEAEGGGGGGAGE